MASKRSSERSAEPFAGQRHPQDRDELIFGLLNGFIENDSICYWEDRSPEENRAREALSEILRSAEPLNAPQLKPTAPAPARIVELTTTSMRMVRCSTR
jgi:hypothetical protein